MVIPVVLNLRCQLESCRGRADTDTHEYTDYKKYKGQNYVFSLNVCADPGANKVKLTYFRHSVIYLVLLTLNVIFAQYLIEYVTNGSVMYHDVR